MIVRWGLSSLADLAGERPFVVAGPRWSTVLPDAPRWEEVPSHRIEVPAGVETIVAVGGGSAIDTAKAASAASGLPLVSVPTTYSGAEWTTFFGVRDPQRHQVGGGTGANLHGIVYEPELTLGLPREPTVGTALNALAHCAEALYVEGHNPAADEDALEGARLISAWLPRVVEDGADLEARTGLLRGACHAGAALGGSMLALGHALAQALGGRYGLPHGAMNALCLPPALRFNAEAVPEAVARFGAARLRRAGVRARRGRGRRGRARRREGESTSGERRGGRAAAALDLVASRSCRGPSCRRDRRARTSASSRTRGSTSSRRPAAA